MKADEDLLEIRLNELKVWLKRDLMAGFITFEDSDVENLTKEEILIFYDMPSLRWRRYWKEMKNEK